jgi:hypothetical protein
VGVLEGVVAETGARLVVIDPVMAFLDRSVCISSDPVVRDALAPLAELAERHGCVVLLVRHLNKRGGGRSIYRGGGSIGLVGACRSAWLIAADPREPARRVLAQVKNNVAPPQPSLAFGLGPEPAGLSLTWLGPCEWTADQLVSAAARGRRRPRPRDRARSFLSSVLAKGPRTAREIWERVKDRGLTVRTLNRAKEELEIRSVRVTVDGALRSYWLLPGQELPADVAPRDPVDDLEPWLKPLREKYPVPTPLDDL